MNNIHHLTRPKKRSNGFTLIEVMIAMTISLILMAGVIQVFMSSQQTYRVLESSSRVQENARFALDILSNHIRMAGYMGCLSDPSAVVNTINSTDPIYNFGAPLDGTNNDGVNSSDSITLRGATGGEVNLTDSMPSTSADLKIAPTTPPAVAVDDIVLISDCTAAAAFQVTSYTTSNGNTVHNTGSGTPGNSTKDLGKSFGTDATLLKVNSTKYYLANGASGTPSLWRQVDSTAAEEMIADIENMQILYGEDTDNDGSVNKYVDASAATMANVIAIQLSLLLRSRENNVTGSPQPYTFNGTTTTPTDNYLRRVVTSTIKIRNRGT